MSFDIIVIIKYAALSCWIHDDVMMWQHFLHHLPFVWEETTEYRLSIFHILHADRKIGYEQLGQSRLQTRKAWPTFITIQMFAVMINVAFIYYVYWLHITPSKDMVYRYVMTKSMRKVMWLIRTWCKTRNPTDTLNNRKFVKCWNIWR